jgi:hypothetical protein
VAPDRENGSRLVLSECRRLIGHSQTLFGVQQGIFAEDAAGLNQNVPGSRDTQGSPDVIAGQFRSLFAPLFDHLPEFGVASQNDSLDVVSFEADHECGRPAAPRDENLLVPRFVQEPAQVCLGFFQSK